MPGRGRFFKLVNSAGNRQQPFADLGQDRPAFSGVSHIGKFRQLCSDPFIACLDAAVGPFDLFGDGQEFLDFGDRLSFIRLVCVIETFEEFVTRNAGLFDACFVISERRRVCGNEGDENDHYPCSDEQVREPQSISTE